MRTIRIGTAVFLFALFTCFIGAPPSALAQTFFIQSQGGVPLPFDPYDGAEPIVTIDAARQIYQVQDNTNDWNMLMTAQELDAMSASSSMSANSLDPGDTNNIGGGGSYTNYFQPSIVFGSNDLWIEITNVDIINEQASLILHGTVPDEHYQLLSSNVLSGNGQAWTLGEYIIGAANTNLTAFSTFNIDTNSQMFFRAHHANPVIAISAGPNAVEPNAAAGDPGQIGHFQFQSYYTLSNDLPVYYQISGTAMNGVDYSNITGVVTVPANTSLTNIDIVPLADGLVEGVETVILTIQQTNDYLIDPFASSATILIEDSSTVVGVYQYQANAIEPNGPSGVAAQIGTFQFNRYDDRSLYPQMTIYYVVSGTASNGVDYVTLTNSLVFSNGVSTVLLDVIPLADSILEGVETATVTLVPTNSYVVDTNNFTQTINIVDSSTTVSIFFNQDAIETNAAAGVGQIGIFNLSRSDTRGEFPPLTVNYSISGTASNGVDYVTLSGSVTFATGAGDTNIFVKTLPDNLIEGDETVTLTLIPNGSAYYISQDNSNATLTIHDTVYFSTVTNLSSPIAVDYYTPSNSLIVSYNYDSGTPTFARIYTNITIVGGVPVTNVVVTNWSGVGGVPDEVYLTIPRMPVSVLTNSAGFTNGDLFFGSGTGIGWLSADATRSNLDWCILTNSVETNQLHLRGGICTDQTGTFSNRLIAVTTDGDSLSQKGVWLVDSKAHPTLLAQILTEHLEGVTTLTNDVQKWGPWAGKIITGDEDHVDPDTLARDPLIYTISTNGIVATNHTKAMIPNGIFPEDFDVILANQNLYITAINNNSIMELPSSYFTNNIGDLLITDAGEVGPAGLYIVHWNSQGSNFVTTSIPIPDSVGGHIEGVTFAPIQLPGH